MTTAPTAVVGDRGAARHKRQRSRLPAAVVAALLVVLAAVGWNRLAAHWAADVVVAWTRGPTCTGTRVVDNAAEGGSGGVSSGEPTIEARRGMHCVIRVEVRNGSSGHVRLEELTLPFMAGHEGPVLEVDTASGSGRWEGSSAVLQDAVGSVDVDLSPDEHATFDIPLVFNDQGCSQGGLATVHHFPTVTVRSLFFSFDRRPQTDLTFRQVGPARGCHATGDH